MHTNVLLPLLLLLCSYLIDFCRYAFLSVSPSVRLCCRLAHFPLPSALLVCLSAPLP